MSRSPATPTPETLTPEQLVVRNIQTLLRARGMSQSELGKRMSALGFHAWWHEKTVRNVLSGERSIKVDELAGLAVALVVTIENLLDERLRWEAVEVFVGPYAGIYSELLVKDRFTSSVKDADFLWHDILDLPPLVHADWRTDAWSGDTATPIPPPLLQEPESPWHRKNITLFNNQGWQMPAPEGELTEEDLELMTKAVREWMESKGEVEPSFGSSE